MILLCLQAKKVFIWDDRARSYEQPRSETCGRIDESVLHAEGKRSDLDEFDQCFKAENRHERKESERFKDFAYD